MVALLFTLASAVPAWSRMEDAPVRPYTLLLWPVLALVLLAWLNCWAIRIWESTPGEPRDISTLAAGIALALATLLTVGAVLTGSQLIGVGAVSALLLYLLDSRHGRWTALALRISAETLYVQAGILEPATGETDLAREILSDPHLHEEQKQALIRIYLSFCHENEVRPERDDSSGSDEGSESPAATIVLPGAGRADEMAGGPAGTSAGV